MKKLLSIILVLSVFCLTGCSDCPKGYEQDGDICKREVDNIIPKENDTCPDGYSLKDNLCRKYEQIEIK